MIPHLEYKIIMMIPWCNDDNIKDDAMQFHNLNLIPSVEAVVNGLTFDN